jgi:putative chitinase
MMTRALQEQGITDPKMINATLANVMKETGGKINVEEDLAGYANTSNERIRSIFGARAAKKSDKELDAIKKDPKQFAEMMYGKDSGMGLGNVEEGDAYKFRGRGAVGLTGRANYAAASKDLFGDDRLVKDPELLKDPEMAAKTSAWFMKKNTGAMAQRMGMAGGAKTQEEANLLATSTIAGQAITPGQGFLGKEALGKVTAYSAQLAGGQTPAGAAPPATAVAAAPVTGFAPGAQQPAAQPTTLASMAQNVLGSIFGGGGGTTAGIAGPTAPAAGSDMASITAALQAQTAATQTAITSGMENMTTRLVASLGTTGGVAGGDPAVPALLGEMVAAQREQTTAINRLIQVQTA